MHFPFPAVYTTYFKQPACGGAHRVLFVFYIPLKFEQSFGSLFTRHPVQVNGKNGVSNLAKVVIYSDANWHPPTELQAQSL